MCALTDPRFTTKLFYSTKHNSLNSVMLMKNPTQIQNTKLKKFKRKMLIRSYDKMKGKGERREMARIYYYVQMCQPQRAGVAEAAAAFGAHEAGGLLDTSPNLRISIS